MAIEPIQFIDLDLIMEQIPLGDAADNKADFSKWITGELNELNGKIHESNALVSDLAVGKTDNIHHVLVELEKTKISFQLAIQVRNKLLEGYQEIMRMQV